MGADIVRTQGQVFFFSPGVEFELLKRYLVYALPSQGEAAANIGNGGWVLIQDGSGDIDRAAGV